MHLSIAFFLGIADTVIHYQKHLPVRQRYQYVFWFEVGIAAAALVIILAFVRLNRAESDMTADEKARLKETSDSTLCEGGV